MRHSAAHLLAYAVRTLFPGTQVAIGPVIENGFYYDFAFKAPLSEKDFSRIEQKMNELKKKDFKFEQRWVSVDEAKKLFADEPYKLEIIDEISKGEREDFGHKGEVSIYQSGEFADLCKGPHVASSKEIGAIKLLSLAGAYWKGNEKNAMLTRVYGTCFATKEELDKYLWQLEEAKKRDHKKLGKELGLFVFSDLVGSGLPLWTPKGTIIRELLNDLVWKLRREKGYQKVTIPHITKKELYETSGHWAKFQNELFKINTREGHLFAM